MRRELEVEAEASTKLLSKAETLVREALKAAAMGGQQNVGGQVGVGLLSCVRASCPLRGVIYSLQTWAEFGWPGKGRPAKLCVCACLLPLKRGVSYCVSCLLLGGIFQPTNMGSKVNIK